MPRTPSSGYQRIVRRSTRRRSTVDSPLKLVSLKVPVPLLEKLQTRYPRRWQRTGIQHGMLSNVLVGLLEEWLRDPSAFPLITRELDEIYRRLYHAKRASRHTGKSVQSDPDNVG